MKKKILAMVLILATLLSLVTAAMAAAPKVKEVSVDRNGKVEVEFTQKVSFKNAKVTVKDSNGKKCSVKIIELDSNDIEFRVSGMKAGKKYRFTVSGVRVGKKGSYGKVSGSFKTPTEESSALSIKKVEYDAKDKELDVKFNKKVTYSGLKVVVKDSKGTALVTRVTDKGDDDVELKVKSMVKGRKYTVTVSGVAPKGGATTTVSKTFTA